MKEYNYYVMNTITEEIFGKFSTIEKGHVARLWEVLKNPEVVGIMLFDKKNNKFIDWKKKDLETLEKLKYDEVGKTKFLHTTYKNILQK